VLHPERPKRDLQEVRGRHERNTRSRRSSLEFLSAERCARRRDEQGRREQAGSEEARPETTSTRHAGAGVLFHDRSARLGTDEFS
jgi:hypothetical protein